MSAAYISTQDHPSRQYIEFSIEAAKEVKNKDLYEIYKSFYQFCDLSYGKVYKRNDNGELWHVNSSNTIARRISEERLSLFLKWDKKDLLPNEELFSRLITIGGLPSHEYSLSEDFIQFPCRAKITDGQTLDLCLLHFSATPPHSNWFKKILLLDEIIDIEPSELTLPYDLRLKSMLVEEIRMSFYPFMVKTQKGNLLLYDGVTQFTSKGEIKGSEIVCQVPFNYYATYKVVDVSFDDITYIVGKWDDRFQKLFAEYRKILQDKKTANTTFVERETSGHKTNNNIFNQLWKWIRKK